MFSNYGGIYDHPGTCTCFLFSVTAFFPSSNGVLERPGRSEGFVGTPECTYAPRERATGHNGRRRCLWRWRRGPHGGRRAYSAYCERICTFSTSRMSASTDPRHFCSQTTSPPRLRSCVIAPGGYVVRRVMKFHRSRISSLGLTKGRTAMRLTRMWTHGNVRNERSRGMLRWPCTSQLVQEPGVRLSWRRREEGECKHGGVDIHRPSENFPSNT
jgi:hypothetical protein